MRRLILLLALLCVTVPVSAGRSFVSASSQYLAAPTAVFTSTPATIGALVNTGDVSVNGCVVSVGDTAGAADWHMLQLDGAALDNITANTRATTTVSAKTTITFTGGVWHSAVGVWVSSSSRLVYIDGGSEGTDSGDRSPAGLDATTIGALRRGPAVNFFSGRIGPVAIWGAALSAQDGVSHAAGMWPPFLEADKLTMFVPMLGAPGDTTEIDMIGGLVFDGAGHNPVGAGHKAIGVSFPGVF